MPVLSASSFSVRCLSLSASGIVTLNGMRRMRRQIAQSVPRMTGL